MYFREFVLLLCLYQGNDACREYVRLERSLLLFFAKSYEYIIVISYVAKSFFKSIQIPLCDVSNNFRYIFLFSLDKLTDIVNIFILCNNFRVRF